MITVRPARDRGHTDIGWLDSRHSFSFGEYYDPKNMGFRALRVINDDRVNASSGFGAHSHSDMEIISYVLSGALGHKDSLGNGSTIAPGDVQRMSAGTGVTHSEWNHSPTEPVHFLQIWIVPSVRGVAPGYAQRRFTAEQLDDRLCRVVAPKDDGTAIAIHQDAELFVSRLGAGKRVAHAFRSGRHGWVQVARGAVSLGGLALEEGDGAALSDETSVEITATRDAEVLLFDLA